MTHDRLVTIFGGGGFVGTRIAEDLLGAGWRVRIAQRNIATAQHIKPLGDLGQTQFVHADVLKPESVARAVVGSDAVVNLVGTFEGNFEVVHGPGAGHIAEAASAAGVNALVHMSAIGADAKSPSRYGRSKAAGEAAVRKAFPTATIMRPSIVFGRGDNFVNRFAGLIALLPVVPIIGGSARFQPVHVEDVAKAFAVVLDDPAAHAGKTYELGGPEVISMADLNRRIAAAAGRDPWFVPAPDPIAGIMASATGWLPGAPITSDQWAMLQRDNVVRAKANSLRSLGIEPTPLGALLPEWMVRYRRHGRFGSSSSSSKGT